MSRNDKRKGSAGSIATADRLVRVATTEADIPLVETVRMITEVPAKIMGLKTKGALKAGYDADIVAFDGEINVKSVFTKGEKVI